MTSVLISNPVWGKKNCEIFCNYNLRSLLYSGNIPTLLKNYNIKFLILTKQTDIDFFKNNKYFNSLESRIDVDFYIYKDKLFKNKYKTLTFLQNISIKLAEDQDFIVFNYADFFWANKSLVNSILSLKDSKKKFLSFFCLPIDILSAKRFVDKNNKVEITGASKFALKNLHSEAQLRFWGQKYFSYTPTFILFKVDKLGIIIRAYHQTVLVAKVDSSNTILNNKIRGNSLDEYFSSKYNHNDFEIVENNKKIMVFALCDWDYTTAIKNKKSMEKILKNSFRRLNQSHRKLSERYILISTTNLYSKNWKNRIKESHEVISSLNTNYPTNKFLYYILTHKNYGPFFQKIARVFNLLFD